MSLRDPGVAWATPPTLIEQKAFTNVSEIIEKEEAAS
jgi:hypothetical protein